MNSKEILDKKFDKAAMFGYKTEEVEDYLREVAQYVDSVNKEKAVLEKKIQILADRINEYRKDEESMKEALLGAQRLGNTVVSEAKEKAEKLLADAQEKADKMLSEAEKEASRAVTGIKMQTEKEQQTLLKMQREVSNFKTRLLSIYKSHLDLITALPEEEKEQVKEEAPKKEQPEPKPVEQKQIQPEPVKTQEEPKPPVKSEEPADPVEQAKRELENTQQIAKQQLHVINEDNAKIQQIPFVNNSQRVSFKSERVDMESSFESKFGELKFGKNNK